MQAKRNYESVFEVDPCDNCGAFTSLSGQGLCTECSSEHGRDLKMAKLEEYLEDKDLGIPEYIRLLVRQCWQGAVRDSMARKGEER